MKVAIIPARGGSKRIPRKNIRLFHGKPIIAYSIETALKSGLFDGGVWVSTEDEEIMTVAQDHGAMIIHRPDHLAEIGHPDCGTQEVTRHALTVLPTMAHPIIADFACCIYPCAPLMSLDQLKCSRMLIESDVNRAAYCYAVHGWRGAGQFYWGDAKAFLERVPLDHWSTARYDVGADRFCDIDTEEDWQRAEAMYTALKQRWHRE